MKEKKPSELTGTELNALIQAGWDGEPIQSPTHEEFVELLRYISRNNFGCPEKD